MLKIRFTAQAAGRLVGAEEVWADETQARAFVDAGVAVELELGAEDVPPQLAPDGVTDRAMRPRSRKG